MKVKQFPSDVKVVKACCSDGQKHTSYCICFFHVGCLIIGLYNIQCKWLVWSLDDHHFETILNSWEWSCDSCSGAVPFSPVHWGPSSCADTQSRPAGGSACEPHMCTLEKQRNSEAKWDQFCVNVFIMKGRIVWAHLDIGNPAFRTRPCTKSNSNFRHVKVKKHLSFIPLPC